MWKNPSHDLNPTENLWMNWNADCMLGLFDLTSVPDLTNTILSEWANPHSDLPKVESLPRTLEAVITAKVGANSVLMPMELEWAHMGVMVRFPQTFGSTVYTAVKNEGVL